MCLLAGGVNTTATKAKRPPAKDGALSGVCRRCVLKFRKIAPNRVVLGCGARETDPRIFHTRQENTRMFIRTRIFRRGFAAFCFYTSKDNVLPE